jgi:hypothetical protein
MLTWRGQKCRWATRACVIGGPSGSCGGETICPNTKQRMQPQIVVANTAYHTSLCDPVFFSLSRCDQLYILALLIIPYDLLSLRFVRPAIPLTISPLTAGMRPQTARDTILEYTKPLERSHDVKLHIYNVRHYPLWFASHISREAQASSPRSHLCRESELHEPQSTHVGVRRSRVSKPCKCTKSRLS